MTQREFDARMDALQVSMNAGRHDELIAAARTLCEELEREPAPDPVQRGWAFFYLWKGLYLRGDAAEAFARFDDLVRGRAHPTSPLVFTRNNAGFMHSVCVELAAKLGRGTEPILFHARRCLDERRGGPPVDVAHAVATACFALAQAGQPALGVELLDEGLRAAALAGDAQADVRMARAVLDCHDALPDAALLERARGQFARLRALDAGALRIAWMRDTVVRLKRALGDDDA